MEERTRLFHEGNVVFQEGTHGETLGYLVSGRIGLFLHYGQPQQFALDEIGPGEGFGEMGVLNGSLRAVTAVALQDCEVVEITAAELPGFIERHPESVVQMMKSMSRRMLGVTTELLHAHATIREFLDETRDHPVRKETLRERLKRYASFFLDVPEDIPPEVYMDYYSRINHL